MRNGLRPLGLLGAWLVVSSCADSGGNSDGTQTDGGGSDAELTWCDVAPILEARCQRCHTDPPKNGAPFPLVSYDDTQVEERYEHMGDAVDRDFMPPLWLELDPPVEPLSCAEKATLLAWVDQGAPPPPSDDTSCFATSPMELPCN